MYPPPKEGKRMQVNKGEIQMSVPELIILWQCQYSYLNNELQLCKTLSLGDAGQRVHGTSVLFL